MGTLKVPCTIVCEAGALEGNSGLLAHYGRKALIVTGPHVSRSEAMQRLTAALDRDEVEYEIFNGINSEPTDNMVKAGAAAYHNANCDFCIGLGGGSPIDAAKAIAVMTASDEEISSYMGREIDITVPPIVACPTTAGTGSEATRFTIITDTQRGIKMLLKGDTLLPQLAIVDYTLGIGAPRSVVIGSGLDALTHAIEAYISIKAMPETDILAARAVQSIIRHLPEVLQNGDNKTARQKMAQAALDAGICINNSSVTVIHGMSRPIGAMFHVPHGLSNAMLLPTCLADMADAAAQRFAALARNAGFATADDTDAEAARILVTETCRLCELCNVPTLGEYGIDEAQYMQLIDKMAADAIASGSPGNAPKAYTAADCRRLYIEAYNRK